MSVINDMKYVGIIDLSIEVDEALCGHMFL